MSDLKMPSVIASQGEESLGLNHASNQIRMLEEQVDQLRAEVHWLSVERLRLKRLNALYRKKLVIAIDIIAHSRRNLIRLTKLIAAVLCIGRPLCGRGMCDPGEQ